MSKFDLAEMLHFGQPASHPEQVEAPKAIQSEVADLAGNRLNELHTAMANVAMHKRSIQHLLEAPEWNPAQHDPAMTNVVTPAAPPTPIYNTTPPMPEQQQEEIIDPALAYAQADLMTISHDVVGEAEAIARAAANDAYNQASTAAVSSEQTDQAPWQQRVEAGIGDPYVPTVVRDVDRLTSDIARDQAQMAEDARRQLEDARG